MGTSYDLRVVGAEALIQGLRRLLGQDHQVTAELLAHLGEVDARRLYRDHACSSTFTYCVERLHMSEPTAYKRIESSRTARRFPLVFAMVADGRLHLTAITLLGPRLTEENHRQLLEAAAHKSKREIEQLLAARFPRPDVPPEIRRLPERWATGSSLLCLAPAPSQPSALAAGPAAGPAPVPAVGTAPGSAACAAAGPAPRPAAGTAPGSAARAAPEQAACTALGPAAAGSTFSPPAADAATVGGSTPSAAAFTLAPPVAPRPEIKPLSPQRYSIKLTVSRPIRDKLLEAQALLRHRQPNGDMEVVLERALDALLGQLRRERYGETSAPRPAKPRDPKPGSRHISNEVKRIVAARDGHQCTFVDPEGHRCQERGFLEFDHIVPVAKGGAVDDPGNARIRCRLHNIHAAEREFGAVWMKRKIAAAAAAREAKRAVRPAKPPQDDGRLEPVPNLDPLRIDDGRVPGAGGGACPKPLIAGPALTTGTS